MSMPDPPGPRAARRVLPAHLRHGGVAVAGSLSNLLLNLARIKLLAACLGPVGVGVIGLIASFIELVGVLFGTGFAGVLNREMARAEQDEDRAALLSAGLIYPALAGVLLAPPLILAFLAQSPSVARSAMTVLTVFAGIIGSILWRIVGGHLQGSRKSATLFWAQVLGMVANLMFVVALILGHSENYVLYGSASPVLLLAMALYLDRRELRQRVRWRHLPPWQALAGHLRMAWPITLNALLITATMFYLRAAAEIRLGTSALGFLQPGLQLIILLDSLVLSFLGITLVRWNQRAEAPFSRGLKQLFAAALLLPLASGLVLFNAGFLLKWVIVLLFSPAFLPALPTLAWFLTAEALQIGTFMLNQTLISRGASARTLPPRLLGAAALVGMIELGWLDGSLTAIAMAYFLSRLLTLAASAWSWLALQWRLAGLNDQGA